MYVDTQISPFVMLGPFKGQGPGLKKLATVGNRCHLPHTPSHGHLPWSTEAVTNQRHIKSELLGNVTPQPSGEKICTVKLLSKEFEIRGSRRKSLKKAEKEEIGRQPTKEKEDNKTTILDVELKFDQKD